ncbi:PAS domain-containing protein [Ferrovibrio xuzhouensis]|uniref:PAS domain-containing protein n=1 Tax=Ferrovibrio xuzhouensis TaxID=1576914 RepID=A0ABV7VII5_9PROT
MLHPRFRWMRDYLSRVAPPGGLPGRQAVDPTVFKALLPFINLVDVIRRPDGLDFRFRLVGTLQTTVAGREITGRHVEEAVLPQFVDRIRANMIATVEHRDAIYDRFPMPHPGRDFIDTERIYYPLASNGHDIDMLLILNGYPEDENRSDIPLPPLPEQPAQKPAAPTAEPSGVKPQA